MLAVLRRRRRPRRRPVARRHHRDRVAGRAPAPEARSEVVAATVGGRIAVVGGFRRDGTTSPRVDLYDPARDRWSRLPDLPVP